MDLLLKNMMKKKGVSPVVATVLLIAMVIVIALIIFLFFRNMTKEAVTKFGDENIELACDKIEFDASYSGGKLYVANNGNTPIFSVKIKMVGDGNHETIDIRDVSEEWPQYGLSQGGTFSESIGTVGMDEIVVIPVLLGNSESGQKTFVCDEKRYGYELLV